MALYAYAAMEVYFPKSPLGSCGSRLSLDEGDRELLFLNPRNNLNSVMNTMGAMLTIERSQQLVLTERDIGEIDRA